MSSVNYQGNKHLHHQPSSDHVKNSTTPNIILENKYNLGTSSKKQKVHYHTKHGEKNGKSINYGDDNDSLLFKGVMKQYCVKGSEVVLRQIHFIRNDLTKLLNVTVDNGKQQADIYSILFTKDVCPYNFKDGDAFVIKVLDSQLKIKSMTFKSNCIVDKTNWLETYGIDLNIAEKLLEKCIEEIEKRRFHLGIKKRHEDRNKIKVTPEILTELINLLKTSSKLDLTDNKQWSVTSLERLIQILLNELVEPLIPYNNQRSIRRQDQNNFNAANETRKILNTLPNKNRTMLASLLGHMERLSKYYLIVMSSLRKDLPHIRHSICQRLTPIIFRLQEELDSKAVLSRACDLLYHTMLCVNGATESSNRY